MYSKHVARPLDLHSVQKYLVLYLLYLQTFYRIDSISLPLAPLSSPGPKSSHPTVKPHPHNQPKGSSHRKTGSIPELPSHITSYNKHPDGPEPFSCHPKSN
ncbi:hypothetical protein EYC80_010019 [Monilinia laxa]|uniref:Uncharacterized protein n=1 Tax=Monilinia laxa TaxID=61186 RepID=A0A5N6JRD1_MONLA|nr:hypothetical protein EYC80_010019 [Monilinia laxa]